MLGHMLPNELWKIHHIDLTSRQLISNFFKHLDNWYKENIKTIQLMSKIPAKIVLSRKRLTYMLRE